MTNTAGVPGHNLAPPKSLCRRCGRLVAPDETEMPCIPEFRWTAPSSHHWMGDVAYHGARHDIYVTLDGAVYDGCDASCNGTYIALTPEPRRRAFLGDRIYAASRASIPERPQMWRNLRDHGGYKIISSWIDEAGEGETASFADLWTRVDREIDYCTRLVLYVEPGDFPLKGALIEVGMALGRGKPVYVVAPGVVVEPNYRPLGSWLAHPSVTIMYDLLAALGPLSPLETTNAVGVRPLPEVSA
jgi:hypothetical protein